MKYLTSPPRRDRCGDQMGGEEVVRRFRSAVPAIVALTVSIAGLATLLHPLAGSAATNCSLASAAFCETFDQGPSPVRGRGGDLDPLRWAVGRLAPSDFSGAGPVVDPVAVAPIPACRSSFTGTDVYPPDDTLICDSTATRSRQLMTAVVAQNYGNNSYMIRQPFDFAGRTGRITFDVDAFAKQLGTFIAVDLTEDPIPAPTFREYENFEPGPVPRNGLMIKFLNTCDPNVAIGNVLVYSNYSLTMLTPTFNVSGTGCATVRQGSLNHFEIRVSQTQLEVWASDFSTDDGQTFPNFRRLYAANMSLPFTRGYVHMAARNHASKKYGFGPDGVYHWDNIGFDGPIIQNYRSYEIKNNTTTASYQGDAIMNLGYLLLDGTTGKPAGIYDPINRLSSLQFQGVNVTGATAARLTLNTFFNSIAHTPSSSWGWQFRFNGGAWRTRSLSAVEVQTLTTPPGSAGNLSLALDVPIGDLIAGTNSLEMIPVNAPMDYPPAIANIDLVLTLSGGVSSPASPTNLRITP
jgi:hypothetical protein